MAYNGTLRSLRDRYAELCAEPPARPAPAPARPPRPPRPTPSPDDLAAVAHILETTPAALRAHTRDRDGDARRLTAMWLLRQRGLSHTSIGSLLDRSPSSVTMSLASLARLCQRDPAETARLAALLAQLGGGS